MEFLIPTLIGVILAFTHSINNPKPPKLTKEQAGSISLKDVKVRDLYK